MKHPAPEEIAEIVKQINEAQQAVDAYAKRLERAQRITDKDMRTVVDL